MVKEVLTVEWKIFLRPFPSVGVTAAAVGWVVRRVLKADWSLSGLQLRADAGLCSLFARTNKSPAFPDRRQKWGRRIHREKPSTRTKALSNHGLHCVPLVPGLSQCRINDCRASSSESTVCCSIDWESTWVEPVGISTGGRIRRLHSETWDRQRLAKPFANQLDVPSQKNR